MINSIIDINRSIGCALRYRTLDGWIFGVVFYCSSSFIFWFAKWFILAWIIFIFNWTFSFKPLKLRGVCRNFQEIPGPPSGAILWAGAILTCDRNNLPHFKPFQVKIKSNAQNCGHFRPHPPHTSHSHTHTCGDLSCGRDDLPLGNERLTNARIHTREHSSSWRRRSATVREVTNARLSHSHTLPRGNERTSSHFHKPDKA